MSVFDSLPLLKNPQILNPLAKLDVLGLEDYFSFFHHMIDVICTKTKKPFSYVPGKYFPIVEALRIFYSEIVSQKLTKPQVEQDVQQINIPQQFQKEIVEALFSRYQEVNESLIQQTSDLSHSNLKEVDWKLHVTISSDKLSHLEQPKILVKLRFHQHTNEKEGGSEEEEMIYELSKDELAEFIHKCDDINQVIQDLKM